MIRLATEEDFESILDLSQEFWKHTIFSEEFDRDHTLIMVKMAFSHGLLAVVDLDGKVAGFCAGIKSKLLASPDAWMGTELAWWVSPGHRGGRNGIHLLMFMEDLAKSQGIKYWSQVSMESSMAVGEIYERMGYTKSETVYTKVI